MFVRDTIRDQGAVIVCRPEDTVQTAAVLLHTNFIGVIPVLDADNRLVGIFGERDIVRALASRSPRLEQMHVSELMTKKVVTCTRDTSVLEATATMKRNRIRHLPVVEGGKLIGIVSIRDALEVLRKAAEEHANVMRDISIAARAR